MRKKEILILLILALMATNCATPKKSKKTMPARPDLMNITDDSRFIAEFENLLIKEQSRELPAEAVFRYFDLNLFAAEAQFQRAFELVKKLDQRTETALMLNNIAWRFRGEEAWFDRLLHISQFAVSLSDISKFVKLDESRIYYPVDASVELKYWANIHDTFAWYLVKNGEKSRALEIYDKILKHYEQKEIYYNYAELLHSLNRRENALRAAIRAMELSPSDTDAELLLRYYAREMAYTEDAASAMVLNARDAGYGLLAAELKASETQQPLPFFQLQTLDGSQISSELYSGSAKIIIIWNLNCESCIQLLSNIESAYQVQLGRSDSDLLTISSEKESDNTQYLIRQNDYSFPVYFGGKYLKDLGIDHVPVIIITDTSDTIRYRLKGVRYLRELQAVIHLALQSITSLP
ncbi:MAG TPA: redoxin domain-containing protein [Candidatus Marinimicrobia bacterium]|nr:redoxin domain-containing protein [Candidatus Neomarinimicrobiota bacterium]